MKKIYIILGIVILIALIFVLVKPAKPMPAAIDNTQHAVFSKTTYVKPSDETIRAMLSSNSYEVTQHSGTETPYSSPYAESTEKGIYVDIVSGEPLFSSADKYDSGTGWPSFVKPITADAVTYHTDKDLGIERTEVRSVYADSHLGHVFNDGPTDRGGKRYCMNGVALRFVVRADMEKEGYSEYLQYVPE